MGAGSRRYALSLSRRSCVLASPWYCHSTAALTKVPRVFNRIIGNIPANAVPGGFEVDGRPLFIARADIFGGLHPGKCGAHLKGATVSYGDLEYHVVDYDVLVADGNFADHFIWVVCTGEFNPGPSGGTEPEYMIAGYEAGTYGAPRYIIQGKHEGGVHPGKAGPGLPCGLIPYGDKEVYCKTYRALKRIFPPA
ncbi:uncharacterized protein BJ171DRAFT_235573 [Polychytrium aggregatum]|uniref:uncharacterized protein n=1 Tax=Polychytrium aggregatum TaxID=110093 RepID=UPI0022FE4946|nr:uncharacterized protein BJ171DRAFT_235573 [Polychytrium aggregatum]KAI9208164.1 hypothetical protein BJ171DRAFT_235573 [Polychytrium aggregatum]